MNSGPTEALSADNAASNQVTSAREHSVTAVFVSIAESLASDYDMADLFRGLSTDCARLLAVDSVGILLADGAGVLQVAAASSENLGLLELYQVQSAQGPCLDCYQGGAAIQVPDLRQQQGRWPEFAAAAITAGYASVHAVPMRLRHTVLGALGLFGTAPGPLPEDDLNLAQAFAHVAAIALVTDRAAADHAVIKEQLQTALSTRVIIEQAKGLLAQFGNLDVNAAFEVLRTYSRDHHLRLDEVAHAVVYRELPASLVMDYVRAKLGEPT
ncbi:MAG: GAF and ANTAR domain-containing protein [Sporichthyaceae bacterium]